MKSPLPDNTITKKKYSIPLLIALILCGLAGNYFKFSIFLNIEFLFGSIFAMLALQFLGLGRCIFAGAMIAGYTYFLWNHPYAIIILTAEAGVVGWLINHRKMGLVQADTLYWFLLGMPLVYLFYHVVMQTPFSNTYISMTTLAVNGIANALIARLIFTGFALRTRTSLTSYREIIYNLLTFFVLCPALIMLAVSSRTDFNETDIKIRTSLIQDNRRLTNTLETWVVNRKSAILNLAVMSASRSPQQMQPYLEQAKKADVNFLYIGLQNREAITTAIFPLIDELGQNNIGKNFADRPYIPKLKQTLKPMLSEVVIGKFDKPKPIVGMLAPVVIRGEYSGYIFGVLDLEQIMERLEKSSDQNAMLYTLLDKNGNVIMTNRKDQKVMSHFVREKGTLNQLDTGISQWVPALLPNTPTTERWLKSFYVSETAIGNLAEWNLILEQPVAPFQKTLYNNYSDKLILLFMILLVALALAEFLSRWFVVTLEKLRKVTRDLPARLAAGSKEILWPESSIKDTDDLISNFRDMTDSLTAKFNEVRQINETLEQRVEVRTLELRNSEQRLKEISIRDPLTNIYNRRYIFERLEIIIVEFFRENKVFTISILDIDHFKKINDKYGHQAGDFILKEFTQIISDNLRPYDLLGRYGGEEFIIVTMNSNKEQTKSNIERIQNIIRNKTFVYDNSYIKFTFSCGISENIEHDIENKSVEDIIGKADERLYEAKKTGRNKVII